MPRFLQPLGLVLAFGLPALAATTPLAADDEPGQSPDCIEYRGEARYRALGYDHVVVIENGCQSAAHCTVSTDVTPEEHEVDVAAGASAEVLTRRGSPARAFTPNVACTLR